MIGRLALALAVLALAGGAAPADERAEKLKVAREHLEQAAADMDIEALIDQMSQPLIDQLARQGKVLSEDQIARIKALFRETFKEPMRKIMLGQDEMMADMLTLEEITALRDFYQTEAGRSVMRKMPEILARQQPIILDMVNEKMSAIIPRIQEIVAQQ